MLAICRWTATCKLRPWTTLSVFDWNTAVLRRCSARMDGFRPIVFCEKRWHRVKMHCQTPAVQDPWFPGIAVTVLLGVHGKSDVAGNNTRALDCFWQAVKHCQQRRQEWGGLLSKHSSGRNPISGSRSHAISAFCYWTWQWKKKQ